MNKSRIKGFKASKLLGNLSCSKEDHLKEHSAVFLFLTAFLSKATIHQEEASLTIEETKEDNASAEFTIVLITDTLRDKITTMRIVHFKMIKDIKDKTIVKATIKEVQDSIYKVNRDVNSVSAEI